MKLYTINATPVSTSFTDSINKRRVEAYPERVASILSNYGLDGFTIYKVDGYWKGEAEVSFKIEVAVDGELDKNILEDLRYIFKQEAVMLTTPENDVIFWDEDTAKAEGLL